MEETKKKGITVRVEPEFHQEIKIYTIQRGMNLQDYILGLIKKDMEAAKNIKN